MSTEYFEEKTCGCMGCQRPAEWEIDHPRHGIRTVCRKHADPQVVEGR